MKNVLKKYNGITLIALVITIIILLILAGVSISLLSGDNGILTRARDATDKYKEAVNKEEADLASLADEINIYTGGGLTSETVSKINNKIKTELIEVDYIPEETIVSVTVDADYIGVQENVVFTQSDTIGTDTDKMKWYLLSANESEVKLVSSVSKKKISFKDSSGYDNCLYYLNEIATKLFKNNEKGITINRVHMLRLSDIKEAAERVNGNTYNWENDFVAKCDNLSNNKINKETTYINNGSNIRTYHPAIYKANASSIVETNNPFYDEEPGILIVDAGITRSETGNPAEELIAKHTYIKSNNNGTTISKLGVFGTTPIGQELFNSNENNKYWIATRSVNENDIFFAFSLRFVDKDYIGSSSLCRSNAEEKDVPERGFRVVISVPASSVNVAADGTVTFIN